MEQEDGKGWETEVPRAEMNCGRLMPEGTAADG